MERRQSRWSTVSVHPHMRGEYSGRARAGSLRYGSSPHAWRIFRDPTPPALRQRFIPTCVENMRVAFGNLSPTTGSSPHAWRIFTFSKIIFNRFRFIPTCVENIACISFSFGITTVHPHMRGEYCLHKFFVRDYDGSSPHAWRIFSPCWQNATQRRFIPTCVENITANKSGACMMAVHPHMRGEYFSSFGISGSPSGSSPHAWRI